MAATMIKKERPASLRKPVLASFVSIEDVAIIQKIQHGIERPDFEFKPLIGVIKGIFYYALNEEVSQEKSLSESNLLPKGTASGFELGDNNLRVTIHRLSWQIICDSACGKGEKEAAFSLFELLRSYSWEAKVVLALAAFAMTYGQFWTNAKPLDGNPLSQLVSLLMKPTCLHRKTESLTSRFNSLYYLVNQMLVVADLIVILKELTQKNETQFDVSTTNALQFAVYRLITSVYTCISYNMKLVKMDAEYPPSAPEILEIQDYCKKLTEVSDYLRQLCKQEREYLELGNIFSLADQSVPKLIYMFYLTDSLTQLLGTGSRKVSLDELNGKTVVFFITHFDVNKKDYILMETNYNKIKETKKFEIVWIPTVDPSIEWNNVHQETFDQVAASMPWYRLCNLSSIKWAFIRYIQQKWHFQRKPILVTLNEHGQVINISSPDSFEFGRPDVPFPNVQDEEEFFRKNYPNPIWQSFVDLGFCENLEEQVEGKVLCFYGGHDYYWITEFGEQMEIIKQKTNSRFKMEIFYIGTSGTMRAKKKLPKIIHGFKSGEWKTQFVELDMIKIFWRRLTYVYQKRMASSKVEVLEDATMRRLMTLFTYDYSEDGWAIMFGGSSEEMIICNGELNESLSMFDSWGSNVQGPVDFLKALNVHLRGSQIEDHCTSLIVPATTTGTPSCFVCGRSMEKNFIFKCCSE